MGAPTAVLRSFLGDGRGLNCTRGSPFPGNSRAVPFHRSLCMEPASLSQRSLRKSGLDHLLPYVPSEEAASARLPVLTQTHRYTVLTPTECLHPYFTASGYCLPRPLKGNDVA